MILMFKKRLLFTLLQESKEDTKVNIEIYLEDSYWVGFTLNNFGDRRPRNLAKKRFHYDDACTYEIFVVLKEVET